jgi:hypothetical protein
MELRLQQLPEDSGREILRPRAQPDPTGFHNQF